MKQPLIERARSLIDEAKGQTLSLEDRIRRAVELTALMLEASLSLRTADEKRRQAELAGMMGDPIGKAFTTALTDQCFRSRRPVRIADQLTFIIKKFGIPHYLPFAKRLALRVFAAFGKWFPKITVPLAMWMLRKETAGFILPGEKRALEEHIERRRQEGVRVNLNHLGEAILGEEEAKRRLQTYLDDLANPAIEVISVKISTLYSQINLLAWQETLDILADRLRQLYRAAIRHSYQRPDGTSVPKFVNLDMEEYKDLRLTVALFKMVLEEREFYHYEAGIVLQSYLPDAFLIQQELTVWAMQRHLQGGAPIKIRLVKGANLAMEQVESALKIWPQAPYPCKADVDANFKRMVNYGCRKEHAQAAHIGIGSHNLFDIAYALLLRAENDVDKEVTFEMLEGMADPMRQVVQQISGSMLLYCPAATKEEFQNAVAYLVRRLDENTAPDNFLRHLFDLKPGSEAWNEQVKFFADACHAADKISFFPRRIQNRNKDCLPSHDATYFSNEPDTDWSLPQNRKWAEHILLDWKDVSLAPIPLVIAGKDIFSEVDSGIGEDPSYPDKVFYRYAKAKTEQAKLALQSAKDAESAWSHTAVQQRVIHLTAIAKELRHGRADLIGAMVSDTGKTIVEADTEVSEAIDFAEYYRFNLQEWAALPGIDWKPKGTILVAPPWNFPCSIPAGGILAALATGNCVIFKPAPESVLVGWQLAQLFWKAGISRSVLQFVPCDDEPVGSLLVKDPRISAIALTGATATAKLFLKMRPGLDLMAETGGKNTMVISGLSDRDLAIKDLLQSAFGHAGQKCSACSLAILEAEVYDDPHFLKQLRDAASSMLVGSPWELKTKINPLIRRPNPVLLRGLTQLEPGETWLLEPREDGDNPNLWSPGIKLGVKPSSFTFQNELFGPVLGLVRADNMAHAFSLMNQTPYGLTAGMHTLDEREQAAWLGKIVAGNCYINRTITGAIVERQPFGGCKESGFGKGAKAGGPNYLLQLMHPIETKLPIETSPPKARVEALVKGLPPLSSADEEIWQASIGSYAYYWKEYFSKDHDPCMIQGQDNLFRYVPHTQMVIRGQKGDLALDLLRCLAAALTCGTDSAFSLDEEMAALLKMSALKNLIPYTIESNEALAKRILKGEIKRMRMLSDPPNQILLAIAQSACNVQRANVLANGRLELLNYLREVSISHDYHRYGNLGERESETRQPLPDVTEIGGHSCG